MTKRVELGEPFVCIVAVAVVIEERPAEREMHDLRRRAVVVSADQPVPYQWNFPDQAVLEPLEAVKVEARRRIHILGRERTTALIVEEHEARPILPRVFRLHLI